MGLLCLKDKTLFLRLFHSCGSRVLFSWVPILAGKRDRNTVEPSILSKEILASFLAEVQSTFLEEGSLFIFLNWKQTRIYLGKGMHFSLHH
jgi:hypothetical protein